jgi:hypothetical protein
MAKHGGGNPVRNGAFVFEEFLKNYIKTLVINFLNYAKKTST